MGAAPALGAALGAAATPALGATPATPTLGTAPALGAAAAAALPPIMAAIYLFKICFCLAKSACALRSAVRLFVFELGRVCKFGLNVERV